jgi:hypothetical protein
MKPNELELIKILFYNKGSISKNNEVKREKSSFKNSNIMRRMGRQWPV